MQFPHLRIEESPEWKRFAGYRSMVVFVPDQWGGLQAADLFEGDLIYMAAPYDWPLGQKIVFDDHLRTYHSAVFKTNVPYGTVVRRPERGLVVIQVTYVTNNPTL